jgi:hypothetical protein
MAKMKLPKPSAETVAYFERIAPGPPIEARKMFGMPVRFLNGHMLVGLFGDTFMLHLSASDREECIRAGAKPFAPMGRESKSYVDIKPGTFDDRTLKEWIVRGMRYLGSLPPKIKPRATDLPAPIRAEQAGVSSKRTGTAAERAAVRTNTNGAGARRAVGETKTSGLGTRRAAGKAKTSGVSAKRNGVGAPRTAGKTKTSGLGARRAATKEKTNGVSAKRNDVGARRAVGKAKTNGVGPRVAARKPAKKTKGMRAKAPAAAKKTAQAKRKPAAGARRLRESSARAKKPGPKHRKLRP